MNLHSELAHLEAIGLIEPALAGLQAGFCFRHALIQEAAYHSLVRRDRQRLHLAAGEILERLFPAQLATTDLAPLLARHFEEAGDLERAVRHYLQAGQAAMEAFANLEAIQHYARVIELGQASAAPPEVMIGAYLRRGRAQELTAQDAAALDNYAALEAWGVAGGLPQARLAALNARATILVKPSTVQHPELGRELSQQALQLAQALGDRQEEVRAMWNLLLYHLSGGRIGAGLELGEQTLKLARAHQLREMTGYLLTELHKVYYQVGRPDEGWAAGVEARAIWRELGAHNMVADNLSSTGVMHILLGEYEPALDLSQEALSLSRAIGNLWNEAYAYFLVDLVHFDRGEVGRAIEVARLCRQLSARAGFAEGISQADFDLALIYAEMGAATRGLEMTDQLRVRPESSSSLTVTWPLVEALAALLLLRAGREAEARAVMAAAQITEDDSELRQWFFVAHLLVVAVRGELALLGGEVERALNATDALLEHFRVNRVRLFLSDALFLRGRLLLAGGQVAEATAAFEAARTEAESIGARRILWRIAAEQARLAEARGVKEEASGLWREAGELIEYIAAHAGSEELARSFRGRAEVREVVARVAADLDLRGLSGLGAGKMSGQAV